MRIKAKYPTLKHKEAAKVVVDFFSKNPNVEAVILFGSCARGRATADSCLDFKILVLPEVFLKKKAELEENWNKFYTTENIFKELKKIGKYSQVDIKFIDGSFTPKPRSWTSGPDNFELEIGNTLVYAVPLLSKGKYLEYLKSKFLPYYNEKLRQERLSMVCGYCLNNLNHIPLYTSRHLYFQSFHRLYDAFREFLQALFISRRIYPIAYNKWIKEQVVEILKLPNLYPKLPKLFEIKCFESEEIVYKARDLRNLFKKYVINN